MPQSIPLTAPTSKTTAVVPFGFDDGEVQAASTSPLAGGHDLKDVSLASRRWSAQGGNAQTAVIGNCRRTRRLETIRGRGQMCGGLSCTRRAPRAAVELDAYALIRRINLLGRRKVSWSAAEGPITDFLQEPTWQLSQRPGGQPVRDRPYPLHDLFPEPWLYAGKSSAMVEPAIASKKRTTNVLDIFRA
jgi:hypothetical protein